MDSPAGIETACNDQVLENNRCIGPSSMRGYLSELFSQRMLPKKLTVAVQAEKCSPHAHDVESLGCGVSYRRSPACPMRRYITTEDIEAILPERFARVRIEANHLFLFGLAF